MNQEISEVQNISSGRFCLLFACFNERARGFPGKKVYAAMAGRLPYQLPSGRINCLISNSRRNRTLSHPIDLY